jgi:hypothetical protein
VTRANKAVRDLDDILSDVEHRKGLSPAAVAAYRQQIEQAKGAIENSLTKPFNDYLEKSREAAEVDRLLLAGRDDEAAALRVVIGLKTSRSHWTRASFRRCWRPWKRKAAAPWCCAISAP